MLSDTLSDAMYEIKEYQKARPNAYGHLAEPIYKVVTVMAAMTRYLDFRPPIQGEYPKLDAALLRLQNEISAIEVSGLLEAMDNLKASLLKPGTDYDRPEQSVVKAQPSASPKRRQKRK